MLSHVSSRSNVKRWVVYLNASTSLTDVKLGFLLYNPYRNAMSEQAQCGYEASGTVPDLNKSYRNR